MITLLNRDGAGVSATDRNSLPDSNRMWTIPNALSVFRLFGSFVMFGLALGGHTIEFIVAFVVLEVTDWLDGKLAIWLDQRTVFGARIDSLADFMLASALLWGSAVLKWDLLSAEMWWIAPTLATYTLSCAYGLWKFHRIPTYHTRAAKLSWGFITVGALCLLMEWTAIPLRVAMVVITLTNLEAILLTRFLDDWRVDVRSLVDVIRQRRSSEATPA